MKASVMRSFSLGLFARSVPGAAGFLQLLVVIAAIFGLSLLVAASRAAADVPIESIKFDNTALRTIAVDAAIAVNDCDPVKARTKIKELRDARSQILFANLSPTDRLKLEDFIKLLERELAARCGTNEVTYATPARSFGFFFPNVRNFVKERLDNTKTGIDIDGAIDAFESTARRLDDQALGRTPQQGSEQLKADARSLRAVAKWLEGNRAAILKALEQPKPATTPTPSRPGAESADPPGQGSLPPGSPGGPILRDRPSFAFAVGAIGGGWRTPGFGAGTTFNVALGREVPILFNDRNLNFAGGYASGMYPLNALGDAKLGIAIRGGSLWGENSATVPVGGANVAYTYLLPNPATNTTGVLAGASGQDIRIRTNGEFLWFNPYLAWNMPIDRAAAISAIFGVGPVYEYSDIGHHITQQSLFFPDVSSRTHLRNDNHFIGGMLRGGLRWGDGNVSASLGGYVAPGVNIFDGRASQWNLCGPCGNPGDRAFSLSRSFSDTRFAVQTGLYLNLGVRLTPSVRLDVGGFHNFTSTTGFLRVPTTPSEQPVRRDFDSTHRYGGRLGLRFTF